MGDIEAASAHGTLTTGTARVAKRRARRPDGHASPSKRPRRAQRRASIGRTTALDAHHPGAVRALRPPRAPDPSGGRATDNGGGPPLATLLLRGTRGGTGASVGRTCLQAKGEVRSRALGDGAESCLRRLQRLANCIIREPDLRALIDRAFAPISVAEPRPRRGPVPAPKPVGDAAPRTSCRRWGDGSRTGGAP
jgi:hypothetical protein